MGRLKSIHTAYDRTHDEASTTRRHGFSPGSTRFLILLFKASVLVVCINALRTKGALLDFLHRCLRSVLPRVWLRAACSTSLRVCGCRCSRRCCCHNSCRLFVCGWVLLLHRGHRTNGIISSTHRNERPAPNDSPLSVGGHAPPLYFLTHKHKVTHGHHIIISGQIWRAASWPRAFSQPYDAAPSAGSCTTQTHHTPYPRHEPHRPHMTRRNTSGRHAREYIQFLHSLQLFRRVERLTALRRRRVPPPVPQRHRERGQNPGIHSCGACANRAWPTRLTPANGRPGAGGSGCTGIVATASPVVPSCGCGEGGG